MAAGEEPPAMPVGSFFVLSTKVPNMITVTVVYVLIYLLLQEAEVII